MIPRPRILTAVLFVLPFTVPAELNAATWFVRTAGHDDANGTSPATAFHSLLRAVQVINHGDEIIVGPGTYSESIFIAERFGQLDKPLQIRGDESGKLTGDAPGAVIMESQRSGSTAIEASRLADASFSGLTFQMGTGLRLSACKRVTVSQCTFNDCSRGVAIERSEGTLLQSCVITRCIIGAHIKESVNTRIRNVSIAGSSSAGVTLLGCGAGSISNSLLTANNTNYLADGISAATWTSDCNVISGDVGPWGDVPGIHSIYEWHAASGQDRHSVHVVPAFADPVKYDLHVTPEVSWAGGLPGARVGTAAKEDPLKDRDGRQFTVTDGHVSAGAYDYPRAAPQLGRWKELPLKLNDGDRQSAAIFRNDGSLVRTLLADACGVQQLWWDGLDDLGRPVPAGKLEVRAVTHDIRIVDDGNYGDNGNPAGTYNADNPERIVVLPDGGFIISTAYDEAGMPLRRYSSSGQPIFASNLTEKDFSGLARWGDDLVGVVGKENPKLVRLVLPGERAPFKNGAESLSIFAAGEKPGPIAGIVAVGNAAFVSVPSLKLIRSFDLETGAKKRDVSVDEPGDLAADLKDQMWAILGTDIASLDRDGKPLKRIATGLKKPMYLASSAERVAVVDRENERLAIIDPAAARVLHTFGSDRKLNEWLPVGPEAMQNPRGIGFLSSGQLVIAESGRTRAINIETGQTQFQLLSNFMDSTVIHPLHPEYAYCFPGIFQVDPVSKAWNWRVESPRLKFGTGEKERISPPGSPSLAVVLDGKPFIVYHAPGSHFVMYDVTDPMKPRLSLKLDAAAPVIPAWAYGTVCFGPTGDLISAQNGDGLQFVVAAFKGLDGEGNPQFDFANPKKFGVEKDPDTARRMNQVGALANDRKSADLYYLATTSLYNKMVPGWGADGTGIGKTSADGRPLGFSLSSGGNYMSISAVNDGKQTFVLAGKSFGGQLDLFDADGLRLTTGNWSWPSNYGIGFVDLRYGVQAYLRPDGKVGAYVEDDSIGRFARARVDGIDTIKRQRQAFDWQSPAAETAAVPVSDRVAGPALSSESRLPKVPELNVDGNWPAWEKAGMSPQIVMLPGNITFRRNVPTDLLQTFRQGTAIGAIAHDDKNLYVYFVITDDTMHFDAETGQTLWMYDGVELWLEEEQFGLSFTKNGKPALFKFRHHDRAGKEYSANYGLASENVWGEQLADVAVHPLGKRLAEILGSEFTGKPGYALSAKIPLDEIKLVGGVAGRGAEILPMTGKPGEVMRVGVSIGAITAHGREQDYKVGWPAGLMFSDPTRSRAFVAE